MLKTCLTLRCALSVPGVLPLSTGDQRGPGREVLPSSPSARRQDRGRLPRRQGAEAEEGGDPDGPRALGKARAGQAQVDEAWVFSAL